MKSKRNLKKVSELEDKISIIETMIIKNKVLSDEEKENLIYSIKYIISIILKYKTLSKWEL